MADVKPPEPGKTSLRFGPASLRPHPEEPDHYELVRPALTVANEGDRIVTKTHPDMIPLAVYRTKRRGDMVAPTSQFNGPPQELRTIDPNSGKPIELVLVWWHGMEAGSGE